NDDVAHAEIFVEVAALNILVPDVVDLFPAFGSRCGSSSMTASARRISARRLAEFGQFSTGDAISDGIYRTGWGAVERRDQDEAIAEQVGSRLWLDRIPVRQIAHPVTNCRYENIVRHGCLYLLRQSRARGIGGGGFLALLALVSGV